MVGVSDARVGSRRLALALAFVSLQGCHPAAPRRPSESPAVAEALALLRSSCALPKDGPVPVPASGPAQADADGIDLAVYTAHPDDESMYGGGTLTRLTRAGRRVALVVASHGEGGRLLLPDANGDIVERRDLPRSEVVRIRDSELREAAEQAGLELAWLHPATANVDDAFTVECTRALAHWDATLGGGLEGFVSRLVADIRERRPTVVLTLDPRDDPQGSSHGHHEAVGVLVDLAVRLAADPRSGSGIPHRVRELWTFAPQGVTPDLVVDVNPEDRLAMLRAYASQFRPEDLAGFGSRPQEHFVLRWRASTDPLLPLWVK